MAFDLLVVGDCNPDLLLVGGDVEPEFGQREKRVGSARLAVGGSDVVLNNPADPTSAWKFVDGIDYTFPAGATIPAFGYALVVPGDAATFRSVYSVPPGVPIFGAHMSNLEVAGFETRDYLAFVVSDLSREDNLQIASTLAPPVQAFLSKLNA